MPKLLIVSGTLFIGLLAGCSASAPVTPTPNTSNSTGSTSPELASSNGGVAIGTKSGRFTVTANLAFGSAGQTATLLPDGTILVTGGGQLDIDDLLISYPAIETVNRTAQAAVGSGDLTSPREFHTATLLQNGKVLIAGGNVFTGYPTWLSSTADAELFDPATGTATVTGSMSQLRTGHTASLLPDGRVLIFGGSYSGTPSADIYDPAKGTFAPAGTPLFSRSGHTATVLASGKVLFVGGQNLSGTLATAEIYDPATNSFSAAGSLAEPRTHHTATLLPNGKVLVTGGGITNQDGRAISDLYPQAVPGSPSQTAELFDPQTATFAPAGTMNAGRSSHTATLLPDGTVLLFGGSHSWNNASGYTAAQTAEIYDPATGSFKQAGTANTGKFWHTATLLPDGTVVLIGGIDQDSALNVVETFK